MLYHTPVMLSSGSEPQLPFSQVTTSSCGQCRVKQTIFLLMYGQKLYISEKYPQLFEMCKGNLDILPPQDKNTNHTGHRRELKYLSTNFTPEEHNVRSGVHDQERILETSLVGDSPGSGDFWKPGLGAKGLAGPGSVATAARRTVPGGLAPGRGLPKALRRPPHWPQPGCSGRGGSRGHLQPLAPQLSPHKDRTNLRDSEHRISGATVGSSPRILGGSTADRQAGAPWPLPLGQSRCHNSQAAEGKQLGDKLRVLNARRKHPRPTRFIFKEIHKRSLGQIQSSQQPHQLSKECHFLAGAGISGYFGAPMKRNPLKSTASDLPGPASPLAPRPGFQKSPDPGLSPTKDVWRTLSWSSALDLTYIPELHQNPKISPEHKPPADPGSYGAGAPVPSQKGPNCFLATSSHPKVTAGSTSSRHQLQRTGPDGSARQLRSPETALTRRLMGMGMSDHWPRSPSPGDGPCTPAGCPSSGATRPSSASVPSCPVPSFLGSRGSALLPGIAPEMRCFHPNACSVFGFWWNMSGTRPRALPGRSRRRRPRATTERRGRGSGRGGPRRGGGAGRAPGDPWRGGGAGRAPGVPGEEGAWVGPRGPLERRGYGSGPGGPLERRGHGSGPGGPGEEGARVGPRGPLERRGRSPACRGGGSREQPAVLLQSHRTEAGRPRA
ncbi:unnamed protein product [Nyctereutes procyonoides]|uniref:(raccoon dog) hypothetical protein n=1 Tax=Nyctereutes procyonoides TaxID=34880 RepID=A0A811ZER2_NYCPR|nr:unnamed protein product [Nyctereutes procyonoides]